MNCMPEYAQSDDRPRRPRRILYAAGPGDVIGTYRHWNEQIEDPNEIVPTYSGQFFELCKRDGHRGWVISSHTRKESLQDANIRIDQRPKPSGISGLRYHWLQLRWTLRLTWDAVRLRADYAVISSGSCHWFALALLPLFRIRVIPCLHNALFSPRSSLSKSQHVELWLTGWFFRTIAWATLSCSREITRQVDQLARGRHGPITEFLPIYKRAYFADAGEPPGVPPFRVLFVGRMEPEKGVFELLEIARRLALSGDRDIEFDFCGTGSALSEIENRIKALGLNSQVRTHGHCGRERLQQMYSQCHIVVVPTTGAILEGFNQVVTEAVLVGRPVVTSEACPAIEYVEGAAIVVPTDDTEAYRRAIVSLRDDRKHYQLIRTHCAQVGEQFYDENNGWRAALARILE